MKIRSILIFSFAAVFAACDIVNVPIEAPVVAETDIYPFIDSTAVNDSLKLVLVEEFTGHKCSYCPTNTKLLLSFQEQHMHEMLIVSIHAGETFALPEPPDYPEDFRTPYGTEIHDYYQIQNKGYPTALVNRDTFEGNVAFPTNAKWTPAIEAALGQPAEMVLGMAGDLIQAENKFAIRVSAQALQDFNQELRLVVVCIEDSVIAPQKDAASTDPNKHVEDYAHRHVLRGKLNGGNMFGEVFSSGTFAANEWKEAKVYADLPTNIVDIEKLSLVAFLIDAQTQTIVQSVEAHPHIIP